MGYGVVSLVGRVGQRLVWGQGAASSLRAVTTEMRGIKITLAAAIGYGELYASSLSKPIQSER